MTDQAQFFLDEIFKSSTGKYKLNYNLAHLTWFKVGGNAEIFFKPEDDADLIELLKNNNNQLPITIIGAGSNIIIRDKGISGIVIKLGKNFTDISIKNNNLVVGAACLNYNLAIFALANKIKNFEFLLGIPGTVGAGAFMNAGAYKSEFKDIVKAIEVVQIDSGKNYTIDAKDLNFQYRKSNINPNLIITKIIFDCNIGDPIEIKAKMDHIKQTRKDTQPITEKTGGSTFMNPPNLKAWELIDQAGLRGFQIGDAKVSEKHCNFMINTANSTASDIETLGELIRKKVKNMTGIELSWEIRIIGDK